MNDQLWSKARLTRNSMSIPALVGIGLGGYACARLSGVAGVLGACVVGALCAAAAVDWLTRILPDPLLLIAYTFALGASSSGSELLHGVATGLGGLLLGHLLHRGWGVGLGDAKLLGVLGLWLGEPSALLGALVAASLALGLHSFLMQAFRGIDPRAPVPLGPWLLGGAWLVAALI
ncbi:prepilin peptidase [Changpingibacter yushuensis]|uniref:prepilin peptidase n=1 Tax=Changpingibacter yushuensis TaxID=2758440 RepID=UPI0015F47464|nr:prepilin peptidase [Changpingibacter yushuensis]